MKYANFSTLGRTNVNIGDYLQFMVTDYLYFLMGIDENQVVRIHFDEVATYSGERVILPFCYSFIYFVKSGKIAISNKITPLFLAVTLSTIDAFDDVDQFLTDAFNREYLMKYAPIGCRDEITYQIFQRYGIPAYINGCMTAIFPKEPKILGEKVFFIDAPKTLSPFIPKHFYDNYEISTQQYYLDEEDIKDYHQIFDFVRSKYEYYRRHAKIVITSRLHAALPLTALGIPVILAKDYVDGRFSFIESYLPIYSKENYERINWNPSVPDIEFPKKMLIEHAIGRIKETIGKVELQKMEDNLTEFFKLRKIENVYKNSHMVTHRNSEKFDKYAEKYWNEDENLKYALWGVSENNAEYWKNYIETHYPKAKLTAIFDRYKKGEMFGIPIETPDAVMDMPDVYIIVCSVGAAAEATTFFQQLDIGENRYCIVADMFIA